MKHCDHLTGMINPNADGTKVEEQQQNQHWLFDKEIVMRHYHLGVVDFLICTGKFLE